MVVVVVVGSSPPRAAMSCSASSTSRGPRRWLARRSPGHRRAGPRRPGRRGRRPPPAARRPAPRPCPRARSAPPRAPAAVRSVGQLLVEHVGERLEERRLDRHRALVVHDHEAEARQVRLRRGHVERPHPHQAVVDRDGGQAAVADAANHRGRAGSPARDTSSLLWISPCTSAGPFGKAAPRHREDLELPVAVAVALGHHERGHAAGCRRSPATGTNGRSSTNSAPSAPGSLVNR